MKGRALGLTCGSATTIGQEAHPTSATCSTIENADQLFREADEKCPALKEELASAKLCESSDSDVEKRLETQGRELLRVLCQSHLRLRSQTERTVVVVGEDDVERPQRQGTSRGLTSIFGTLFQETYVMDGQETLLRLKLKEIPTPWYEEWWPWTIIGTVVVGAVVAVVLLLPNEPDSGTVTVTIQ